MITSYLMGGLGNILFQVSAALSLGYSINKKIKFSIIDNQLSPQGNGIKNYKDNILSRLEFTEESFLHSNLVIYEEPSFSYTKIPEQFDNLILKGYFQSEKYFKEHEEKIKNIFSESEEENAYIEKKYGDLLKNYICTSIHVRRGDYLGLKDFHPFCSSEYYMESINYLKDTEKYIIFSDDLEWCKNNLYYLGLEKQIKNVIFIDEIDFLSLRIMSKTKNNIIANSTFSWWGAWLNNSENTVICPEQWFGEKLSHLDTKDLIPERWKKMK